MQASKDTAKHPGGNGGAGLDLEVNRSLIKINMLLVTPKSDLNKT